MDRSRIGRRAGIALGALALYAGVVGLVLPWAARGALERRLGDALGQPVTIRDLDLHPFTFCLAVEDLRIGSLRDPAHVVLPLGAFDYQVWASLFGASHRFRDVALNGLALGLTRRADGVMLAPGHAAPPHADGSEPATFLIDRLVVDGGSVVLHDAGAGDARLDLHGVRVAADGLGTGAAADGRFQLQAQERRGARLAIDGRFDLRDGAFAASVETRGVQAELVRPYLASALPAPLVALDAEARFAVRRDAQHPDGLIEDLAVTLAPVALGPAPEGEPSLRLERVALTGGRIDPATRAVGATALTIEGGRLTLVRAADGAIALAGPGTPAAAAAPAADTTNVGATDTASPAVRGTPSSDGESRAGSAPAEDASGAWTLRIEAVDLGGVGLALRDEGSGTPIDLSARVDRLRVAPWDPAVDAPAAVALEAGVGDAGRLSAEGEWLPARGTGRLALTLRDLALPPVQPYLARAAAIELRDGRLGLDGTLTLADAPDAPRVRYEGTVTVDALKTVETRRGRELVSWRALRADPVTVSVAPDALRIGTITAEGAFARVIVSADRSTNFGALRVSAPAASVNPGGAAPLPLAVERVAIRDSRLRFADFSLSPRFATTIEALGGEITGLSSAGGAARVELAGQVDAYAPVTVRGRLDPVGAGADTDLTLTFRNVELATLTPYSGKFAGYAIDRGKLDLDLRYTVAGRKLAGENRVVVNQLALGRRVDSADAMDLPLQLAIALLTDRNGVIDLDIPVRGDLDDPEFRLGRVYGQAVKNLLLKIVTAPFALLATLGGGDAEGDALSRVVFAFGEAAPLPAESEKFVKLRRALAARPQLALEIRGVADPVGDRRALQEAAVRTAIASAFAAQGGAGLPAAPQERALIEALYRERVGEPPAAPAAPPDGAGPEALAEYQGLVDDWLLGLREALRDAVPVDDRRLLALAEARAAALREAMLGGGEVPPEQVFLARSELRASGTSERTLALPLGLAAR